MKIYKEKEDVTFKIGSKTFEGHLYQNHVCMKYNPNYAVFDALNIPNKKEFCSKHYGYRADDGGWPECKSGDYEALSRLIHALQELCDKHNDKTTQKFSIGDKVRIIGNETTDPHRFEIGEIVTIEKIGTRYYCSNQKDSWMVNIDCVVKIEDTITPEELKCFKKIINQTTQLNYHGKQQSCNRSEGIELCTTSISISTGETYRGKGVSDSGIQIYI